MLDLNHTQKRERAKPPGRNPERNWKMSKERNHSEGVSTKYLERGIKAPGYSPKND